jgi:hypothetical protein
MNVLVYMKYMYPTKNGNMNEFKTILGIYPSMREARFIASRVKPKLNDSEKIGLAYTDRNLYPETSYKVTEYVIQKDKRSKEV